MLHVKTLTKTTAAFPVCPPDIPGQTISAHVHHRQQEHLPRPANYTQDTQHSRTDRVGCTRGADGWGAMDNFYGAPTDDGGRGPTWSGLECQMDTPGTWLSCSSAC